jgi:DNA-binding CsgD family transcriptional regulator
MMAAMDATQELDRAREAAARGAWSDAYAALEAAGPLGSADLELQATAAFMLGREDERVELLERAQHAHAAAGALPAAARCAFWIGFTLALRGETARAGGWFGRARRLLERHGRDTVEAGYLLLPRVIGAAAARDHAAAEAAAAEAAAIAERFGDADLLALALHEQGLALVGLGRADDGMRLVDEAMVAVCAGELSPIVTGLVYCSVIDGCREVYELRRAQEWTTALSRWCEEQPDMVAFTGRCLVHRAEILQLHGAWDEALDEARRAGRRATAATSPGAAAAAVYREGELRRLQGAHAAAEAAYREAARAGFEPQPGLALLRLAQGRPAVATTAIRRLLAETHSPLPRARLLPAAIEIELATGDAEGAGAACDELGAIAARRRSELLDALVAHARGAVALAEDDAAGALVALRDAAAHWNALRAPYEAARSRELLGVACRALGDEDAAALELDAAREAFGRLGALPDRARVDALVRGAPYALSDRELQVLRRLAAGETNRAIAAELVLSERTVERHVSNIFAKLGVSSRTAAAAFAYEHRLV